MKDFIILSFKFFDAAGSPPVPPPPYPSTDSINRIIDYKLLYTTVSDEFYVIE